MDTRGVSMSTKGRTWWKFKEEREKRIRGPRPQHNGCG